MKPCSISAYGHIDDKLNISFNILHQIIKLSLKAWQNSSFPQPSGNELRNHGWNSSSYMDINNMVSNNGTSIPKLFRFTQQYQYNSYYDQDKKKP